jgi:hypothetical protein
MRKVLLSTLALAFAAGLSGVSTDAFAQSKPKAKGPNHEAMMATCKASTKDMYTGDQRVFTYGYCVSKLPHGGSQARVAGR